MESEVAGQKIRDLIQEGAEREDDWDWKRLSASRSRNHFHAPNRSLDRAGWHETSGMATPLWAQNGTEQTEFIGGDWSWKTVRDHYYTSLTALDKETREARQTDYLKGLGYQMHLVQDMSQPNHVRDDTHIADGFGWKLIVNGLETWAKENDIEIIRKQILDHPDLYPVPEVQVDLKALFNDDSTMAPVARLYDTRTYAGNPSPSTSLALGLAEYTSANFFSESTAFAAERYAPTDTLRYFPYPRKSETNLQEYIDGYLDPVPGGTSKGKNYETFVISKLNTSGEPLNCVAVPGPSTRRFFLDFNGEGGMFYRSFRIDRCMQEYAEKLLPRTVAYSKALLDYFHRGKLTVTPATNGITFRQIKLTVQNDTPNEVMGAGQVTLVIHYKPVTETPLGGSKYLLNYPTDETVTTDYVYKISAPQNVDLTNPQELTFDFSAEPLPANYADMTMQLVYRGKLGNEEGAVAVSPVTPVNGINADFHLNLPASGVFARTTNNTVDATFNELRLSALKDSPGGLSVPGGRFELALEYRLATSDPFQSVPVDTEPANAQAYIIRIAEKNGISTLQQGVPTEMVFDLSALPLPVIATDVKLNVYYVVDATQKVYAIGYRDPSEATPMDVFNNADKICVEGTWFDAGDPQIVAYADSDSDGVFDFDPYPHNIANLFTKAYPVGSTSPASDSNFTFSSPMLLTGGSSRRLGFILTDYDFSFDFNETWINASAADPWPLASSNATYSGTGFIAQTDSEGTYLYGGMQEVRGSFIWWGASIIYVNRGFGMECDMGNIPQ